MNISLIPQLDVLNEPKALKISPLASLGSKTEDQFSFLMNEQLFKENPSSSKTQSLSFLNKNEKITQSSNSSPNENNKSDEIKTQKEISHSSSQEKNLTVKSKNKESEDNISDKQAEELNAENTTTAKASQETESSTQTDSLEEAVQEKNLDSKESLIELETQLAALSQWMNLVDHTVNISQNLNQNIKNSEEVLVLEEEIKTPTLQLTQGAEQVFDDSNIQKNSTDDFNTQEEKNAKLFDTVQKTLTNQNTPLKNNFNSESSLEDNLEGSSLQNIESLEESISLTDHIKEDIKPSFKSESLNLNLLCKPKETNNSVQLVSQQIAAAPIKTISPKHSITEVVKRTLSPKELSSMNDQINTCIRDLNVKSQKEGEIQLSPPEWGNIRIQLQTDKQEVSLKITTEFPFVKEQIEKSLGELKQMLSSQGMHFGSVHVGVGQKEMQQQFQKEEKQEKESYPDQLSATTKTKKKSESYYAKLGTSKVIDHIV